MKKTRKKINRNKETGFVILFSMLISSIILLISSGIFNIVQKQVVLSSYARESQKAFYAADAALDCALFHDVSPLLAETAFPTNATDPYSKDITCGGGTTTVRSLDLDQTGDGETFSTAFVFRYYGLQNLNGTYIGAGCAYVLVEKDGAIGSTIETRITAAGFNVCRASGTLNSDTPDFDDPRLLERRISIRYSTL